MLIKGAAVVGNHEPTLIASNKCVCIMKHFPFMLTEM